MQLPPVPTLIAICGVLSTGCPPPLEVSSNEVISVDEASNPGSDEAWQTEVSLARTLLPDGDRAVVAAYIDGTQSFEIDPMTGLPIRISVHSRMGVAVRRDSTGSWEVSQPLQPRIFRRIANLRADPWLATDETGSRVYYSFLATTEENRTGDPDAIAIARSDDGGLTWNPAFPVLGDKLAFDEGPLTVVPFVPGTDKPSIAARPGGRGAHVAFVCPRCTNLEVIRVITLAETSNSFDVDFITANAQAQNPIIRLDPMDPSRRILVAFQERAGRANGTVNGFTWRIRIAISDDGGVRYRIHDVTDPDEVLAPATPEGASALPLRNGVKMDYASPGDGFHYIVYESGGVVFARVSLGGAVWSARRQLSSGALLAFQPTVAGFRRNPGLLNEEVAFAWYEQVRGTPTTTVLGVTTDLGLDFTGGPTVLSRDATGTPITFEPCPRLEPSLGVHFFGDYIGLIPIDEGPDFFAAWADSREGCTTANDLQAVHQHVRGTVFQ